MAFGDADASTPSFVKTNTAGRAATTGSFTPPAGALLIAVGWHDTAGGNLTNTSVVTDSLGLTWTRKLTVSKQDDGAGFANGHLAVSIATATGAAMTVTSTGANTNNPAALYCRVITGADATQFDVTPVEGTNVNGVISVNITTVTDGARCFLVATDWNLAANMTAGTGQTAVVADGIGSPDMRVYLGVQNAVTSPAGSVTMSTSAPTTGNTNNYAAIAVRPAAGGGPTAYTQSLSGAVAPAGALVRQAGKIMAGTITPSGVLAVLKAALRSFAGSITPTGTLTRQTNKVLGGAITPAGSIGRLTAKAFAGAIAAVGTLAKRTAKQMAGSIAPVGAVTTEQGTTPPVTGIGTPRVTSTVTRWLTTRTLKRWITTTTDGGDP